MMQVLLEEEGVPGIGRKPVVVSLGEPTGGSVEGTSLPMDIEIENIEDGNKNTFERARNARIDYYDEAGSLLVSFGPTSEKILESNALVLLGLSKGDITSIEILLDDDNVAEELSKVMRPYRNR